MARPKEGATWKDSRIYALMKVPGKYTCPGIPGFGMHVSPKLLAVWRVRHTETVEGKRREIGERLGRVAGPNEIPDGVECLSLQQAMAKAKAWLEDAQTPAEVKEERRKAAGFTINNMISEYCAERVTRRNKYTLSPETQRYYRNCVSRHLQPCADWSLLEMQNSPNPWKLQFERIAIASPSWANGCMGLVSGIYNYLLRIGVVQNNPIPIARALVKFKPPERRKTFVPTLDLPRFLRQVFALRNQNSRDAICIWLLSGMRRNALLQLRWKDVDFEKGVVVVTTDMTGWKRWTGNFVLCEPVLQILKARFAERDTTDELGYIFPARNKRDQGKPGGHMRELRASLAIASAGCTVVAGPHIVRRTFATITGLIFKDDIALVGALLAHKWATPNNPEANITLGYIVTEERLLNAGNRVADVILQLGGRTPLTDATLAILHAAAIDTSSFKLTSAVDDDE